MDKCNIKPSRIEKIVPKTPILCGPGPCNISEEVKQSMTDHILSTGCEAYHQLMADIRKGLKYVFQTDSDLVLAVSGSGHSAMETVITNLVGPGEAMLIASRGIWDERSTDMANRYGIKTAVLKGPPDTTFTIKQIEAALDLHRPKALFITHGDSSTGTLQDVRGLGPLCHKYGAMLIVDTVVSLCAVPFLMDEWDIDAVYTSMQKAFGGPAGFSPVAFGPRAEDVIKTRNFKPPFYYDVQLLAAQWSCYTNTRTYHHTMCPPLMYALHACLREVCAETLPVRWARHAASTKRFHEGLKRLPIKFYVPDPERRLCTVTPILLPDSYNYPEFAKYLLDKHNIVVGLGLGPTTGKTLRIGLLAMNATEQIADAVLNALEGGIKHLGPRSKV